MQSGHQRFFGVTFGPPKNFQLSVYFLAAYIALYISLSKKNMKRIKIRDSLRLRSFSIGHFESYFWDNNLILNSKLAQKLMLLTTSLNRYSNSIHIDTSSFKLAIAASFFLIFICVLSQDRDRNDLRRHFKLQARHSCFFLSYFHLCSRLGQRPQRPTFLITTYKNLLK